MLLKSLLIFLEVAYVNCIKRIYDDDDDDDAILLLLVSWSATVGAKYSLAPYHTIF